MKKLTSPLKETPDPNDSVMIKARARKMAHAEMMRISKMIDKYGSRLKKLDDYIAELRDEKHEFFRQQDFEAGIDADWGDDKANSDQWGGRLNKIHDKLMRAIEARQKLEKLIYGKVVS